MTPDTELAIINAELQKFDPALSAKFNPAEDESVDSEFEVMRHGLPFRHDYRGETCGWSIQCCLYGGGYAVNRHVYVCGELEGAAFHYDGNNLRRAARTVGAAITGKALT